MQPHSVWALRTIRPSLWNAEPPLSARARFLTRQTQIHRLAQSLSSRPPFPLRNQSHPFSTTPCLLKKGGKPSREDRQPPSGKDIASSDDPFDFSLLEAEISSALERLKDDLSQLRAGGRFNPSALENLRVQLDKSDSSSSVRASDVAQMIPKGRTIQILVGEQEHVKPVATAIQSSALSLTPEPDPSGANPLLLVVKIPAPTAESRAAAVAEAARAGERANKSVRDARAKQQKKQRALQLSKSARPDDLNKAGKVMEQAVEKGSAEVKRVLEHAKKVLES